MKSFKRFAYKIGSFEDENNPPTVDDNSAEYTSGIFTFNASHFTNNFQDVDGDSYKFARILSLPYVGDLLFSSNPVSKGFTFPITDVGNLTYELPSDIMISSTGYCKFDEPIDDIITTHESQGFELSYMGGGEIKFKKTGTSVIPNDTDIYAFFDATSMKIEDAQAAQQALVEWYNTFKDTNSSFTGELYILPIVKEDWLDFPNIILRGSSNRVRNNSDRPNDDFMALAILPPNFDTSSNDTNLNWTAPTKAVTLAFIDEVAGGSEAYHKNRNGYGFDGQPSSQYLTDYKNFRDNYNRFDFFKGILYPIPNIEYGNYNNIGNAMVLQGFAAIEGGATYTLAEIENLGVSYAKERRFHWHLDPTHTYYTGTNLSVANPYSKEANTDVPNSTYTLEGLKNYGWVGIYDKDQPASNVFTSDTFSTDLNKYFQGTESTTVETKTVKGDCIDSGDICFDFMISDDNKDVLFSNQASFCFTGVNDSSKVQEANAPTVDDVHKNYDLTNHVFSITDFTNNFQDSDGDSYNQVKLLTGISSSKNINLDGLTFNSTSITYPKTINNTDIGLLNFQISNTLTPVQDRLYQYTAPLTTLITNLESQGYSLLDRKGGVLEFYKLNTSAPESPIVDTIKGNDIGNLSLSLDFKTSDDSQYNLFSNTAKVYLDMQNLNTAPTVEDSTDVINSNEFSFGINHFTNNFTDVEGNNPYTIRIESIPEFTFGEITFKGYTLDTPFAFDTLEVSDLKYSIGDRFVFQNGNIFSFEKDINTIISEQQALGYTLTSNTDGVMTFEKDNQGDVDYNYVVGNTVTTKEYCITFKVSDDNDVPLFSNQATLCIEVPEIETPIDFNYPPTVGDNTIDL